MSSKMGGPMRPTVDDVVSRKRDYSDLGRVSDLYDKCNAYVKCKLRSIQWLRALNTNIYLFLLNSAIQFVSTSPRGTTINARQPP
jgi:hypothetical protein